MTRDTLDRILNRLKDELMRLESMVRLATQESVEAMLKRDQKKSLEIYRNDRLINQKRFELENECIIAIATQHPMAVDLRLLASILEICTELERMGDYAKGIARINLMVEANGLLKPMQSISRMTAITTEMLQRSVRAFVDGDVDEAREIPKLDDQVDSLYNRISQGLIEEILQNPEQAEVANHLQWAVHNIERMADRVTNICERTVYVVTGIMNEFEESDDEYPKLT